jgi:hypothetical protein
MTRTRELLETQTIGLQCSDAMPCYEFRSLPACPEILLTFSSPSRDIKGSFPSRKPTEA